MKNKPLLFAAAAISGAVWLLAFQTAKPSARPFVKVEVTSTGLPAFLENQEAMKDLPEDARISLRFYTPGPEGRRWDKSYSIGKSVQEGEAQDPDLEVSLDSKVIPELGGGLCEAVTKARADGTLGFKLNKSPAALLWKYKGVMKHKSCFGY